MLFSSSLLLRSKWNAHQWRSRSFAEKTASSFTLREEHYNSSSKLMCMSLLNHKDGTRTIEMILVSTVLKIWREIQVIRVLAHQRLVVVKNESLSWNKCKENTLTKYLRNLLLEHSIFGLALDTISPKRSRMTCLNQHSQFIFKHVCLTRKLLQSSLMTSTTAAEKSNCSKSRELFL